MVKASSKLCQILFGKFRVKTNEIWNRFKSL